MTPVPRETRERLETFAALLEKWNARINLVSPRDMPLLWERHIDDSLRLVLHRAGCPCHRSGVWRRLSRAHDRHRL